MHFSTILSTSGSGLSHRAAAHHVSHHCLTLPGLLLLSSYQGQAMSSVPSQAKFLSQPKTGKLTWVLHTSANKSCSWLVGTKNPTFLLHGEVPGLSRRDHICLLPRDHWPRAPQPWQCASRSQVSLLPQDRTCQCAGKQGPGCVTHLPHYWGASCGGSSEEAVPHSISRPCPQSTQ